METNTILVIGANGQLGTELTAELRAIYGSTNVIASDIQAPRKEPLPNEPFEQLDVMNAEKLAKLVDQYKVTEIRHFICKRRTKSDFCLGSQYAKPS